MIETPGPEMKKQIARIGKAVAKLETMVYTYPRWHNNRMLTKNGEYAVNRIDDIKGALKSLEMVLI